MSSIDRARFQQFTFDRGGDLAPEYWDHDAVPEGFTSMLWKISGTLRDSPGWA
jgi:hypothetical protein